MRKWILLGMVWGMGLQLLPAQQTFSSDPHLPEALEGAVYSPSINPSNPHWIAFARVVGSRQQLLIYQVDRGRVIQVSDGQPPSEVADDNRFEPVYDPEKRRAKLRDFKGYFDWRPVLDNEGRHWFAFVRDVEGAPERSGLFLSYLNLQGDLNPDGAFKIDIDGVPISLRWSPDGRRLTYILDGDLYAIGNLTEAIHAARYLSSEEGQVKLLAADDSPFAISDPVRLADHSGDIRYPDWSPDGRYLAYSADGERQEVVRERIYAVKAVSLSAEVDTASSSPVLMTADLKEGDGNRPSWSPGGNYIAYYLVDEEGSKSADTRKIGIIDVEYGGMHGTITRGRVERLWEHHLDEGVVPHSDGGPAWIETGTPGTGVKQTVLYVKQDEETSTDIIRYANVTDWLVGKRVYQGNFKFNTDGAREVRAARLPDRQRRLVFTARSDGANRLEYRDFRLFGDKQVPLTYLIDRRENEAFNKSLAFPGLGQLYKGEQEKGRWFIAAESAALAGFLFFTYRRIDVRSEYDDLEGQYRQKVNEFEQNPGSFPVNRLNTIYDQWTGKHDELKRMRNWHALTGGLAVGIWVYNLVDVSQGFPIIVEKPFTANITPTGLNLKFRLR